jgi:hypothetical protein
MGKLKYNIKRMARVILRCTRDLIAPKDGVPRYAVKWKTLDKFFEHDCPVIETGTYLGESTMYFAKRYTRVLSFEPFEELARYNAQRFKDISNIRIVNATSDKGLSDALDDYSCPINFWLDGHFSGAGTFGTLSDASPVLKELEIIFSWADKFRDVGARIAVDDARLFTGLDGYPSLHQLSETCRKFNYELKVKNDIFLISK